MAISLLFAGLIILYFIVSHYWRPLLLVAFGERTEGVIEDFSTEVIVPASLEEFDVDYPVISFQTQEGNIVREKYETLRANLVKGTRMRLWYDAKNPKRFFPLLTYSDIVIFCLGGLAGTAIVSIGLYLLVKL